jgi:hypothetical protein
MISDEQQECLQLDVLHIDGVTGALKSPQRVGATRYRSVFEL